MLFDWQGKAVLTKVTKAWSLLAPSGAPVSAPLPLVLSSSGGGLPPEFVCLF